MLTRPLMLGCLIAVFCLSQGWDQPVVAKPRVEAVKGKEYKLSLKNGPWMILVTTISEPPPERRSEGLTPQQAANELVYELRSLGLPAYTFTQQDIQTTKKRHKAINPYSKSSIDFFELEPGTVAVIAGNYPNISSKTAQKTLAKIKKYQPKFLKVAEESKSKNIILQKFTSGGIFKKTPGRPGPLSRAFLIPNPLLTPEEISQRKRDPLLIKLNSGTDLSLYNNPGDFTLVVATFRGNVKFSQTGNRLERQKVDKQKEKLLGRKLDQMGVNAWELAKVLRKDGIEAYVYHDRYQSIVTVGSFKSHKDPRIVEIGKQFRADYLRDPITKKIVINPITKGPELKAKTWTIPHQKYLKPNQKPQRYWIFDPEPAILSVPKV